jgi:2-methylcitrate dehydratase PrpD
MKIDRRSLVGMAALAAATADKALAQSPAAGAAPAPAAAPPPVTRILAKYAVNATYDQLPANVRREGVRTFLNWVGVAVGGSRHETIDVAVKALSPFSGPAQAQLLGRKERFDISTCAFINGVSSHIFDFDDTHLKTIIHPAGPVASAILALAEYRPVAGPEFLNALVLGVEAECRIGNAVYPEHYSLGWHITGSCGPFGSAVACGKLLGLNEQQMACAISIAASQPVGVKIQFGTMTKSFHPGRAAQNGLMAALLAQAGYTADPAGLEGKDGWAGAVSPKVKWGEVTEGLGTRYEAALNTYKPFACGIVMHPAIDAAIQLKTENRLTGAEVESAELHCNPLVTSLTGKTDPQTGLESKFSIYQAIAVAILEGAGGERQFSDRLAKDPAAIALRKKVTLKLDPAVPPEKCDLTLKLKDGRVVTRHISEAIGSTTNPMTDPMLDAKFTDLAKGVLTPAATTKLIDLCRGVEGLKDVGAIARAARV